MDIFVLQAIARELSAELVGGRIQKLFQPNHQELLVVCGGLDGVARRLVISADPIYPRIHLTKDESPAPAEPTDFCLSLRNHLVGARISRISAGQRERVVQISLEKKGPGNTVRWYALMAEIMGRWSNIILVNAQGGDIADAIRQIPETQSRERPLVRNTRYQLPPEQEKIIPGSIVEDQFHEMIFNKKIMKSDTREISRWLVRSFSGVSPGVASEIVDRVRGAGWDALWQVFSSVIQELREKKARPVVLLDSKGVPENLIPIMPQLCPPKKVRIFETMNEAADYFYRHSIPPSNFSNRKAGTARELRRHSGRVANTLQAIKQDIEHSRESDLVRLKGEILLEKLTLVEEKSILYRANHMGEPIDIALNPRYTISENAQRYFRRYKKLRRQAVIAGQRKKAIEEEQSFLNDLSFDLDEAASIEDLAVIWEGLIRGGFKPRGGSKKEENRSRKGRRKKEENKCFRPWRQFQSTEGWQIYLGKSAMGNDALLREIGRNGDLWFHAQGVPGSHVILRMLNGDAAEAAPYKAIQQAAVLAVYYSRARGSTKLNVDYLPFQRLKRPRRSRPGQVIFTGQNTLAASPDDALALIETLEEIK